MKVKILLFALTGAWSSQTKKKLSRLVLGTNQRLRSFCFPNQYCLNVDAWQYTKSPRVAAGHLFKHTSKATKVKIARWPKLQVSNFFKTNFVLFCLFF